MKAIRFHQYGGPEVLRYEDAPDPVRGPGEVLVRVKACALNRLDLWQRMGPPRVTVGLPHISGSDISGVVEEATEGEKELQSGAEVIVNPGLGCGRCERCLSGRDNQCRYYGIIGSERDGGYA
jgi:NADPH:quinone reductase-like Zn-dependent oxidoreductase